MKFFYRFFYSRVINGIYRTLLRPLRFVIPTKMKVPVRGTIRVTDGVDTLKFYSNESSPMTRILFWNDQGFTFEFSNIFKALILEMDTFVDIGANVGYYSLLAAAKNSRIKVVSMEPSNGPNYFLMKNIELNGFSNIFPEKQALAEYEGEISFFEEKNLKYSYLEHHASGIGNTVNSWEISNFTKYNVPVTTLNSIVKKYAIENIDLIKMDTEGTEDKVLLGGINSILQFQPIIICEVLPGVIGEKLDEIVIDRFSYIIYQFVQETCKLQEIKTIAESDRSVNTNFFFVPSSKKDLISSFVA